MNRFPLPLTVPLLAAISGVAQDRASILGVFEGRTPCGRIASESPINGCFTTSGAGANQLKYTKRSNAINPNPIIEFLSII